MTGKRCVDCRYTKGIGYDFWCGEGHTEYEVFGAETNCPYFEYHDWSKGVPSMTDKRFDYEYVDDKFYDKGFFLDNGKKMFKDEVLNTLNELHEENKQLRKENNELDKKSDELHDEKIRLIRENTRLKKKLKEHNDMLKWHQGGW